MERHHLNGPEGEEEKRTAKKSKKRKEIKISLTEGASHCARRLCKLLCFLSLSVDKWLEKNLQVVERSCYVVFAGLSGSEVVVDE